jgi:hypothetical protein
MRRREGRRRAVSFDMQPSLYGRMVRFLAVISRDRGERCTQTWYVQECIERCLKIDCARWIIDDDENTPPQNDSL